MLFASSLFRLAWINIFLGPYRQSTCMVEFNPFAPGDFAEKRVLKLVEWFSGHCRAVKS